MAQQSGRSAADSESARDAERTVKTAKPAFGGWNVQLGGFEASVVSRSQRREDSSLAQVLFSSGICE